MAIADVFKEAMFILVETGTILYMTMEKCENAAHVKVYFLGPQGGSSIPSYTKINKCSCFLPTFKWF